MAIDGSPPPPAARDAAPRETEAKFRVHDRAALEARLSALGAVRGAAESERNALFDDAAGSLRATGCALRVRGVGGRGLVTFKGPAALAAGVKSRLELETGVDDPARMTQILEAVGLSPRFRYEKRRTTWRFDDAARPLVVVDETPIGLFAEIEGDDAAVRALAREMGVSEREFLRDSYAALYEAARAADPGLPADMTFAEGG